jgi:outer membrane protein OmpA-like peptidoglycan-associated protein
MHKTLMIFGAAAIAATAQAQSPISYEAGVAAHTTKFESITTLDNGFGLGINVGTFVLRRLSIDLSTDLAPNTSGRTGNSLTVLNNRADLIYNHPVADRWRAMIGGGWTGTHFRGDKTKNEYDSGLNALVGLRYCVNDDWSWTGQAIADFKDPADQTPAFNKTTAWTLKVGLARAFGKNRAKGPCVEAAPAPAPVRAPAPAAPQPAPQQAAPQQQPAPQPAAQPAPQPAPQPAAQPAPAPKPPMTFAPVYFEFDKSALTKASKDTLDGVVKFMNANASANVLVTGYTDDRGNDDYNSRLGARRATVVKNYLVSKGIAAGRIQTATKGEADPAESNATAAGRAKNRRAVAVEMR